MFYRIGYGITFISLAVIVFIFACFVAKKPTYQPKVRLARSRERYPHGIIFGKEDGPFGKTVYAPEGTEGHVFTFGSSGSGKSVFLINTLKAWAGPAVVIDVSGDLSRQINDPLKLVYEPGNPDSAPFNVFYAIDQMSDPDDRAEALDRLSHLIMPKLENSTANADFFNDNGRNILTAAMIAFYEEGMDFCEICQKILASTYAQLFREIDQTENTRAIALINMYSGASEVNTQGAYGACSAAVKLYGNNRSVRATLRRPNPDEIAFSPAAAEDHKVMIKISEDRLSQLSGLLNIILSEFIEYFSQRSLDAESTILFCADELTAYGRLPQLPSLLARSRKRKIVCILLTQNAVSDLDDLYGPNVRKSMISNCAYQMCLGISEGDSQKYLSDYIGREYGDGHFYLNRAEQRNAERYSHEIIMPQELGRLGDHLILIYPGGIMRLQKPRYF